MISPVNPHMTFSGLEDLATLPSTGADPNRPAIAESAKSLNYGQLHASANQVARFLVSCGVGAGHNVGVLLDRSIDFVIAVLGITKAGAAYVPLDPSYPAARLTHMIADARIELVFSTSAQASGIAQSQSCIAIDDPAITLQSTADVPVAYDADQIAYVIYTSGSTGTPKGVEITRGNLRNLVEWHRERFAVTASDRGMLLANVGFDAAVWELWPYLASGAGLCIPDSETIRDPETLRNWIVENKITVAFIPTLLAEVLMQMSWPQDTALRYLLVGGDTLRHAPRVDLPFAVINDYGPAECAVVATSGVVSPLLPDQQLPDIGRPISGVQVYLLDAELKEALPGAQGEICIGGAGVGRGYLNRPDLTAEKFILWQGQSGAIRLYRTGDLGALREDGTIQFLGRIDDQVQIRGYRIERGEVEAALNSLPYVQTSAVVAREYGPGDMRLLAYIVAEPGVALSRQALRNDLRLKLPEYMIPLEYLQIDTLPVSNNGKIDRARLPEPAECMVVTTPGAGETPVEAELMGILKKLLNTERIDREDNFFLLGGHSFMAAQVIARIRSHFGVELSLRTVFDHPTPMAMAQQIEQCILARL